MNLTYEKILNAARRLGARGWDILAAGMGAEDGQQFRDEVNRICPRIESYFMFHRCCHRAEECRDRFEMMRWRYDALAALVQFLGFGSVAFNRVEESSHEIDEQRSH